jgi:hypothetical protein
VGEFYDLAEVHDGYPVGDMPDYPEVMGDEDIGEPELLLEVREEVQHLGLDRHIEGGDRLVGHDQLRPGREGPGDADPLALAAGELVRIAVEVGGGEAHDIEEFGHLAPYLRGVAVPVDVQRLGDDLPCPAPWVQGGVRILEDQLEPGAYRAQPPGAECRDVLPVELDPAAGHIGEPDQAAPQGGLAAAGLADDAQGFPRAYFQ